MIIANNMSAVNHIYMHMNTGLVKRLIFCHNRQNIRKNEHISIQLRDSPLTYKIFKFTGRENLETVLAGKAHRVGVKGTAPSFIENTYNGKTTKREFPIRNHGEGAPGARVHT